MITIEFWGPAKTEYGPVLRKNSELTKLSIKDAYQYAQISMEDNPFIGGFIKIFVNGKWVPSHHFIEQYERTHIRVPLENSVPQKPNIKIFIESPSNLFVAVNMDTKEDVFKGDKWAMEKWLDVNGYFQDDEVKFEV